MIQRVTKLWYRKKIDLFSRLPEDEPKPLSEQTRRDKIEKNQPIYGPAITESEDDVPVVKRIHVTYHLKADESDRETIERVHDLHAEHCPVAQSIKDSIEVSTELVFESKTRTKTITIKPKQHEGCDQPQ